MLWAFCACGRFMNFSSSYHVFGKSQTEQVRNSGTKLVSTRQVLRGEIQKALVTLGEVQPATLPTRLVPSCQAQHLPSSLAAPQGGRPPSPAPSASHSSDPRAPGMQGCPAPAACQLPGSSQYTGGCPVWQAGSSPSLGRQALWLRGCPARPLPCCAGIPARWAGRRQAPCVATSLGNLGNRDLWENVLFWQENTHGQINCAESRRVNFRCVAGSVLLCARTPSACRRGASLCEFSDSTLGLAHKCKTARGLCHNSLAHCRASLTSSSEKPYSISAALYRGKS